MIIFLSHPDASVVRRSKLAMEPFLLRALDSSYLATPDGQVAGSRRAVDNRCCCKPLQTSQGEQPLLAVTLWKKFGAGGLRVPVGVQASLLPTAVTQAAVASLLGKIRRPHRRCDAFSRAAIRDRGLKAASGVRTDPCTAGNVLC